MEQRIHTSELAVDTLRGFTAKPKFLYSKYFYDDVGSEIFMDIMKMPEYYLTRCEEEILIRQKEDICKAFFDERKPFSLVELGSGDGMKTRILLKSLYQQNIPFRYIPIDISKKANDELRQVLRNELPDVEIYPRTGDYIQQLQNLNGFAEGRKVVLFLGSNIGNFSEQETVRFLNQLSTNLLRGDKLLIGFDLIKSPDVIMKAYNDPHGYTRRFNLNLLSRLNRELGATFELNNFKQHTEYNPVTGTVKSYLVSLVPHTVHIKALNQSFHFKKWEPVFVERSQKFDEERISKLADENGYKMLKGFYDNKKYFVDALWEKI